MMLQSTVRLYEVLPSGDIEALLITDPSHYGGTCPDVGDVIVQQVAGGDVFFSVQRRLFVSDPLMRSGWVVLLNRTEPTPLIRRAREEWVEETKFWLAVAREEAAEKEKKLDALLAKKIKPKKLGGPAPKKTKRAAVKNKPAPLSARDHRSAELDLNNQDPAYWTPARKRQLGKIREGRIADVDTDK